MGIRLKRSGRLECDDFRTDFDGEFRECFFVAEALLDFHVCEAWVSVKEVDHLAHARFSSAEGSIEAFVGDDDASLDSACVAVCVQFVAEEAWVRNMSEFVKENNEVGLGHWGMLTQDALLWRGWFDAGYFHMSVGGI